MTTASLYATFAKHNAPTIRKRARALRAAGDGMAWGQESHSLREAAADMGATVIGVMDHGCLVCELSDRLYLLSDVNGPWAVEVATQEDLAA